MIREKFSFCCNYATLLIKNALIIALITTLASCSLFGNKKEEVKDTEEEEILKKKDLEFNTFKRIKQHAEENPLFSTDRLKKNEGTQTFGNTNILWRATLDSLEEIPLQNIDYIGGMIMTDWYKPASNNEKEFKIQIRFVSNEIAVSSIKITTFIKTCLQNENNNCQISKGSSDLNDKIKQKIIEKVKVLKNTKPKT